MLVSYLYLDFLNLQSILIYKFYLLYEIWFVKKLLIVHDEKKIMYLVA